MILSLSLLLLFVWKSVTPITLSFLILSGTLCASLRMKARQKERKLVHGGLSSVRSNSQRACYGELIRGKDTAFENVRGDIPTHQLGHQVRIFNSTFIEESVPKPSHGIFRKFQNKDSKNHFATNNENHER